MDGLGTVSITPVYGDTLTYGEGGWGGGNSRGYPWRVQSTDGPGSVRVTPVYGDTLTLGGGIAVAIHGWSGVCHSNSGVRGCSDIGGGGGGYSSGYPWMVRGLS